LSKTYVNNANKLDFELITEHETKHFVADVVKNMKVCVVESLKSKSNYSVEIENKLIYKHDVASLTKNRDFIEIKQLLANLDIKITTHKHENIYMFCKYRLHYNIGSKTISMYL
jgi:hypothetical protein